jgi:hypothetical protein
MLNAGAGGITLTATGGTVTVSSGTQAADTGNIIQTDTSLSATGGTISLSAFGGTLTAAGGTLTGSTGSITQTNTTLSAAADAIVIDATAGTLHSSSGGTLAVTAGDVTADSTKWTAPLIEVSAPTGTVAFNDATFVTSSALGNLTPPTQEVGVDRWAFAVQNGTLVPTLNLPQSSKLLGLNIYAGNVDVTGAAGVTVSSPQGAGYDTTTEIILSSSSGTINFGAAPGFVGGNDILLLNLNGGTAEGNIKVAGLNVVTSGIPDPGKSNLDGFIGNDTGPIAASVADVTGQPQPQLELNNCALTATDCVLLPLFVPPVYALIQDVTPDNNLPQDNDTEFDLPNVAREDY